ncbi:ribonuclease domain-containing protein [Riemerella anatipestifer]|uniref:ribonuclease domain-containing protein n=1 Tax=Riemerella anatipestifer TaxID=34085 RepID=UPI001AD6A917|nr:ribonuclease domain-containing protein [Riemerella anatipestifer]MBO4234249.1 ribonuclease N [Riemerella anatipestifer]MDY3529802.1 ribonuclease domain-containing protein [Riemerella anatipestifer]
MKYLNNKWIFLVLGLLAGTLIGVKCFQKSSPDALNNVTSEVSTSASSQESTQQDIEALTEENTVIAYIKEHHELPAYYITKSEAKKSGWNPSSGNLCEVLPGKAIGGDKFRNRENQLPRGDRYYEADINYQCGRRNADRLVFTKDGKVWITKDHYKTFQEK